MSEPRCPAVLISGPSSGIGKTTVTAALARHYKRRGLDVRIFKTGPDFLDPMILERASGHPVYQLDMWMTGEDDCRRLLALAAATADLILVEGVMGLYDGTPSSADLAAHFGIPILLVIDAAAMAQTFGAIAHGLATYRSSLTIAGVFANRVGSAGHAALLAPALPDGLAFCGYLPRDTNVALPDRHLGLVQADEVVDLDSRLDRLAEVLALAPPDLTFPAVAFDAVEPEKPQQRLAGVRIAIAKDAAFSFIYPANIDLLTVMGAELVFFSPLANKDIPECDAIWLPGGYPELHLAKLSASHHIKSAIQKHHASGKAILAECGGMLYLTQSLTNTSGERALMAGVLRGHAVMQTRLAAIGTQSVAFTAGEIRGHSFHYSRLEGADKPVVLGKQSQRPGPGEAIYRVGSLLASYVHFYFPSCPAAVASMFTSNQSL